MVAGPTVAYGDRVLDADCELCEASQFTEWYHHDDLCWIADCDSCGVPMVVWRVHDPSPPEAVRTRLHELLSAVVAARSEAPFWIDDRLRSIPDHYHAHARRRPDWST
jgi:hypothetical protein